MRLFSQLINGISRGLQELHKYFNGTIISSSFVPSLLFHSFFCVKLNEVLLPAKLLITQLLFKDGSSLYHWYEFPEILE